MENAWFAKGNMMDQPTINVVVTRAGFDEDVRALACEWIPDKIRASENPDLTFFVWSPEEALLADPAICAAMTTLAEVGALVVGLDHCTLKGREIGTAEA